ncbi:hypothetical protein JM658_07580 [Joostella atrarenae]|uniref:Uncharacterized protein n=1 Tax=Joostella atrarenae TaxID=679257 RepID=A0ABS9J2W5_9FLAO|nr:hypothetical protein [Joostella atrarenae]MCF8714688.1 hypothetical protein [Joostella atrarenae]
MKKFTIFTLLLGSVAFGQKTIADWDGTDPVSTQVYASPNDNSVRTGNVIVNPTGATDPNNTSANVFQFNITASNTDNNPVIIITFSETDEATLATDGNIVEFDMRSSISDVQTHTLIRPKDAGSLFAINFGSNYTASAGEWQRI